jgi:soluble lytic murein transglycosylase-like protein
MRIAFKVIASIYMLFITIGVASSITTLQSQPSSQCPANEWFSQLSKSCESINTIIVSTTAPEGLEQQMATLPEQVVSTGYSSRIGGAPTQYDSIILDCASQFNVNPNLVKAVIRVESDFNPNAVSKSGAKGLMQLTPSTFNSLTTGDIFDPRTNICAGTEYLSQMLNMFNGNIQLAEAAYNAGPGAVQKYHNRIPPYPETQNYVASVTNAYNFYNA